MLLSTAFVGQVTSVFTLIIDPGKWFGSSVNASESALYN
uniref:Uncharacterized protein n=1 Tax=Anguilla anguilla TaxID=7936 RepID=A0A0E9SCA7_ANGAN